MYKFSREGGGKLCIIYQDSWIDYPSTVNDFGNVLEIKKKASFADLGIYLLEQQRNIEQQNIELNYLNRCS
jgi:hypothetical protein